MNKFILSNSIKGLNGSEQVCSWNKIYKLLCHLKSTKGSIVLSIENKPLIGPDNLEVRSEKGLYLITLLYNITKDEDEVRTLVNGGIECAESMVEILGDLWSTNILTKNFDIIVSIFKEFFETGNISESFLY